MEATRKEAMKKVGYTYLVSWEKKDKFLGMVPVEFFTTDDAVNLHKKSLSAMKGVRNLKIEKL